MKFRPDLALFPLDEDTVVFSEAVQCLVGLNPAAANITELLLDGVPESGVAEALVSETGATPEVAEQWVRSTIDALASRGLLRDAPVPRPQAPKNDDEARFARLAADMPAYSPFEAVAERRYRLLDTVAQVRFSHLRQVAWVDSVLGHLATSDEIPPTMVLDIQSVAHGEDRFGAIIYRDGKFCARAKRLFKMGPSVKSAVWLTAVNAYDFLFNLHSGVVGIGETCILLPASAGSGKSSLTAALTHRGFQYFSDEVALLERDTFKVPPVPLALCAKSTGWDVVARYYPEILDARTHHRTDGKLVRYHPVPEAATAKTSRPVSHIFFPRYQANGRTELKPLPRSESLRRLMEECQAQSRNLTLAIASDIVRWIAGIDCYTLVFSSLDEAVDLVEKVVLKK